MSDAARRFVDSLRANGRAEGQIEGVQAGLAVGVQNGRAEGMQRALLTLLRARGLSATDRERARIEECTDPNKLEQWIARAVSAGSVGEMLRTNRKPRAVRPPTKQRARK